MPTPQLQPLKFVDNLNLTSQAYPVTDSFSQIPTPSCSTEQDTQFTLRTANAMLPLVRSIVRDIVELSVEITQIRRRLEELGVEHISDDSQDVYSTEVAAVQDSVDRQSDRVRECVAELNELGVWPRSLVAGYVDFPAMREGKEVCLCWRLGEPEVMYWHSADEPCSRRQLADLSLIRQSGNLPQLSGSA
jgi:hypothetical protein